MQTNVQSESEELFDESLQELFDLVENPIRVKPNHTTDDLIGTQLSRFTSPEEARLEINALSELPDEEWEEDGDFDDESESEYREDDFVLTEEDDEDWWDRNNSAESESEDDEEGYW